MTPRTAIGWLQDYADCLDGTHGPEAQRVANEWMEDHVDDLPTDGTSWQRWRDFRQTWKPEDAH